MDGALTGVVSTVGDPFNGPFRQRLRVNQQQQNNFISRQKSHFFKVNFFNLFYFTSIIYSAVKSLFLNRPGHHDLSPLAEQICFISKYLRIIIIFHFTLRNHH